MSHFTPCLKSTDAPEFASMFLKHVIRLHGIPDSLVSDHGSIFTSHFWKSLSALMNMKQKLSTAFHPQTDGQTEKMNQTLEQYLGIYCNYEQGNWANLLSLAELAYNNSHQPTTDCSPFYVNYGYNLEFTVNLRNPVSAPAANVRGRGRKTKGESLTGTAQGETDVKRNSERMQDQQEEEEQDE